MKRIALIPLLLLALSSTVAIADDLESIQVKAEKGDADAQISLGRLYLVGGTMPQNDVEAVKWFRKAAEQGDPFGQQSLADMYKNGLGVPQDYVEAVKWYRKAAEQGEPLGQQSLGDMYNNGFGVHRSVVQAYMWYNLAASKITAFATTRDDLAKTMTSEQIAEGQRLSRKWEQSKFK